MRDRAWKLLHIVSCFAAVAFCSSCESSDNNDITPPPAVTNSPPPAPAPVPTSVQLGSGDRTVVTGGTVVVIGPYTAPGAGVIAANIVWSEGTQITAFFKKDGPENFGWVQGASPLTSTASPISTGDVVTLYLVNGGAVNAATHFTVTYVP